MEAGHRDPGFSELIQKLWVLSISNSSTLWYSRTLWGAWAQKLFWVPHFWLQEIVFFRPPWPSLSSKGRFLQLLIMEVRECRDNGEAVKRNNSTALGQGPGSPWRDINNIFKLLCRYWTPTMCEILTKCCPLDPESQRRQLLLISWPTNQKNVYKLIMFSLNHCYKTHYASRLGHTVLRAAGCGSLCLAKQ